MCGPLCHNVSITGRKHEKQSAHHSERSTCLKKHFSTPNYTLPWLRTTSITNAASPGKGRDSVKLTALSTVIPETPRTEEGAQLLTAPPMHKIQPKESLKDYLKHPDGTRNRKLKTKETKHSDG